VEAEVLLDRPDSKDPHDLARLLTAYNQNTIEDLNQEALTSTTGIYNSIHKLGKKLPVVKAPFKISDLTG